MIRNLSIKHLLLTLVVALFYGSSYAQTTIQTNYTTNGGVILYTFTGGQAYVTFSVTNGNTYPIIITDVGANHNSVSNPVDYELWYSSSDITGNPNIAAPLWTQALVVANYSNVSSIQNVFPSLNIQIPGKTTYRFAIAVDADNTLSALAGAVSGGTLVGAPAPGSFNAAGVVLNTVSTDLPIGNLPNTQLANNLTGFLGNIRFYGLTPPNVTVNKSPACIGDDIILTASSDPIAYPNPVYTWYKGTTQIGGPSPSNTFTVTNAAAISDNGNYCVTVKDANSSFVSDPACIKVEVSDPPAPKVEGKFNYCLNELFEPVTVNGDNPRWYYTDTLGSPIPVIPTINTTTPNTLTFYVSQTIDGCEGTNRTRVDFKAAPKPPPPTVTTPIYYCQDDPADQLTAVGDNLRWYFDEVGGIPSQIAYTPETSKKDSFDYFVTQNPDGCESDRAKIDVVVTFRPNGLILLSTDRICQNDTLTIGYYGSAFPSSAYLWDLSSGQVVDGIDQGPLRVIMDKPGTFDITLVVGNQGCFSELYKEPIVVKPLPDGKIIAKDDHCIGQQELISLDFYTPTTDTFLWNFDGGQTTHLATDQGPYGVFWTTEGQKVIKLTLVDEDCRTDIFDTINVHRLPDARILTDGYTANDVICSSDSIKLSVATIEPASTYQWTPARFFDTYSDLPVAYGRVDFTGYVKLEVTDEFGCIAKDSLLVTTRPCCDIAFPSAFTPNMDGHNDYFRPLTQGFHDVKTFKVVNRYGQTIYETNDITRGWDGMLNGDPQDMNTYQYYINYTCNGERKEQTGEFILIR